MYTPIDGGPTIRDICHFAIRTTISNYIAEPYEESKNLITEDINSLLGIMLRGYKIKVIPEFNSYDIKIDVSIWLSEDQSDVIFVTNTFSWG